MTAHENPLVHVQWTLLVDDARREVELAEVVQQCAPLQSPSFFVGQMHLSPDEVGVDANAFAVAAGVAVMIPERRDEQHDLLGRICGIVGETILGRVGHELPHAPATARVQCDAQA